MKETRSELEQEDKRMKELQQHTMNQTENEMIRTDVISFGEENIREGIGKETTVKGVGDLTLASGSDLAMERTYEVTTKLHGEEPATVQAKDGGAKKDIKQMMPMTDYCVTR